MVWCYNYAFSAAREATGEQKEKEISKWKKDNIKYWLSSGKTLSQKIMFFVNTWGD